MGDTIALRAMDMYLKYSPLAQVCSKNPVEVRDALAGSRIAAFGRHRAIQMDEGASGEMKFGPIFVQSAPSVCSFRAMVLACGTWDEEMDYHAAVILGSRRMVVFQVARF